MQQLHPIFNVVKLTAALEDPIEGCHIIPPPAPIMEEGEEEWEVKEVLDSQMHHQ
jgi:hypothetical protein